MISQFMSDDHRRCDVQFTQAENAADQGDMSTAKAAFNEFVTAMERHFAMEEQELFPAFEQATGMAGGPTAVMRTEHEQMRALFAEMQTAEEKDQFLGLSETLLVLMQQHNLKEENILYPMTDQQLAAQRDELLGRMEQVA